MKFKALTPAILRKTQAHLRSGYATDRGGSDQSRFTCWAMSMSQRRTWHFETAARREYQAFLLDNEFLIGGPHGPLRFTYVEELDWVLQQSVRFMFLELLALMIEDDAL